MQATQQQKNDLYELTEAGLSKVKESPYYNEDLAPTQLKQRSWGTYHIAALWVGMSVCIPTYMMASGLMSAGLSWWQAVFTIMLANLIILIPIQLNSHAGTKYGIPYPVFARLSFGVQGAHLASVARAVVAAGWFGIQAWIGGAALDTVIGAASPAWAAWAGSQWVSFLVFWGLNVVIAYRGLSAIKFMESWGAPILGLLSLGLVVWAITAVSAKGSSVADILNLPATYQEGQFWSIFLPGLAGIMAFWSTLSLNIPDFSRYARTQREQFIGQMIGMPTTMTLFALIGVFVTGASKIVFDEFIWDPTALIAKLGPAAALLGAIGIAVATLTTNIAANVVAPANGISNISPKRISYKTGALITGLAGIAIMPWRLLASADAYIFGWLGTYGTFLGPLAGLYVADYYVFRKKRIDAASLFAGRDSRYWYNNGFNWPAIGVWMIAALIAVSGKFVPALGFITDNGITVGFLIAFFLYPLVMKNNTSSLLSAEEMDAITASIDE